MKNFKIILYILPLLACLSFININSYAGDIPINWGTDVLNGTNGSANINSLLGDTYSFESLYSPGFVVGLSNAYDQINNTLYDKFGWDLDDAGQKIIDLYGGDDLGAVLAVLSHIDNIPAFEWASNGYQLYRFARSGGGQSLIMGVYDSLTNTVTNIYNNALNFISELDIANITSTITDLKQDGVIYDNTASSVYFMSSFVDYGYDFRTVNFSIPVYLYSVNGIAYFVSDTTNISISGSYTTSDPNYSRTYTANSINWNPTTFVINGVTYYSNSMNMLWDTLQNWNGVTGQTNFTFHTNVTTTLNDVKALITSSGYSESVATSFDFANDTTYNDVMALLDSLKGHWVDTNDMVAIRELLDGGVIVDDSLTGEKVWELDGTIVDSLADIIDDVLEKSLVYEDELGGVIDDSLPDNPDNPDPDDDDTGISVPPDYPTETFDTVNDIIRSPLQFFSIFEPIFMIFGSSALIIFGLWLFVPCVIIIGFIVWALK